MSRGYFVTMTVLKLDTHGLLSLIEAGLARLLSQSGNRYPEAVRRQPLGGFERIVNISGEECLVDPERCFRPNEGSFDP